MEIFTHLIEKYCYKINSPVCIFIYTTSDEPCIYIRRGEYWRNGGLEVILSFKEIEQILELNNIIGENGMIHTTNQDNVSDGFIYTLLAKYINQMLSAARGETLYTDVVPLPHHKETFFRIFS